MRTSFAVATLVSYAHAFWGMGHLLSKYLFSTESKLNFIHQSFFILNNKILIVAREAESLLKKNNPDALNAALEVLKPLQTSKQYPDLIKSEGKHPFTECATFADEIKGEGMSWQSDWHFVDQPYFD